MDNTQVIKNGLIEAVKKELEKELEPLKNKIEFLKDVSERLHAEIGLILNTYKDKLNILNRIYQNVSENNRYFKEASRGGAALLSLSNSAISFNKLIDNFIYESTVIGNFIYGDTDSLTKDINKLRENKVIQDEVENIVKDSLLFIEKTREFFTGEKIFIDLLFKIKSEDEKYLSKMEYEEFLNKFFTISVSSDAKLVAHMANNVAVLRELIKREDITIEVTALYNKTVAEFESIKKGPLGETTSYYTRTQPPEKLEKGKIDDKYLNESYEIVKLKKQNVPSQKGADMYAQIRTNEIYAAQVKTDIDGSNAQIKEFSDIYKILNNLNNTFDKMLKKTSIEEKEQAIIDVLLFQEGDMEDAASKAARKEAIENIKKRLETLNLKT